MHLALATCSSLPAWEIDDRPLHEALRRRGIEFTLAVWDDPSIDWGSFDACLIRTTWDYQEKRPRFVDWASRVASATALFNDFPTVEWNTHKRYLHDLQQRGAPTVPTVWLERGDTVDLNGILAAKGWTRAFLKPAIGATSRETMRFHAELEDVRRAQLHLDRMLPREDMLLQPYLASVETEGEIGIIFIDREFSHAVRKIPVPGDYRVQDDFGGKDEPVRLSEAERALAQRIVRMAGGDPLYARVDFLRDDEGALRLTELELVEPSLFFRHGPDAADHLVDALLRRIKG